jgi:beta-carotene ketolase (CrtW type)
MNPARQGWTGMALAAAIIAAWTGLHLYAVFLFDWRSAFGLPLAPLLLIVLTWLSVGMYIVAHDAMHGSLCPAWRAGGDMVGRLALLLYAGFSFARIKPKHDLHHRHSGSAQDPDFATAHASQAVRWYLQFLTTYFGWRELAVMALRVTAYLLLGASVWNILLFFAVPGILSSLQLFYFGTFLPHRHIAGRGEAQFADHHRARSNEFNYLLSLLTCFHFGYHHEHHLQPGMPWWRLPGARSR